MSVGLQLLQMKDAFLAKTPVPSLKSTPTELKHYLEEIEIQIADFQDVSNCLFQLNLRRRAQIWNSYWNVNLTFFFHFVSQIFNWRGEKSFGARRVLKCQVCSRTEKRTLFGYWWRIFAGASNPIKKVSGEMSRRIELNEKFDCFINRLVKKAETITKINYKIDVVVEQFSKCLRPMDREVIQLFPDQTTGTGLNLFRAKAKLLDDRK